MKSFNSAGRLIAVMELVGQRYRPGLGTAIQVAFSLGYMLQPVIAYRLRDEFWYQVAATSPNLIFPFIVMYVWISFVKLFSRFFARCSCCLCFVVWFIVVRKLFCPWPIGPVSLSMALSALKLLVFGVSAAVRPRDCLSASSLDDLNGIWCRVVSYWVSLDIICWLWDTVEQTSQQ